MSEILKKNKIENVIEKVFGTKTHIKNIVKEIKKDKKFVEKFNNEKDNLKQETILKEKVEQYLKEEEKKLEKYKKQRLATIFKEVLAIPSSRGYKGNEKKIKDFKNIQMIVKKENRVNPDKGIRIAYISQYLNTIFKSSAYHFVADYELHFITVPYWKNRTIDGIKKALKLEDVKERAFKTNDIIEEIYNNKFLNLENNQFMSIFVSIIDRIILEKNSKKDLNELDNLIMNIFKEYFGISTDTIYDLIGFERGVAVVLEEKFKDSPITLLYNIYREYVENGLSKEDLIKKLDNLKASGSYYCGILREEKTEVVSNYIKGDKYTTRVEFMQEILPKLVDYLLNIKYIRIRDNKEAYLFTGLELATIFDKVFADLKKIGVVEKELDSLSKDIKAIIKAEKLLNKNNIDIKYLDNGNIRILVGAPGESKINLEQKEEEIKQYINNSKQDKINFEFVGLFNNKGNEQFLYKVDLKKNSKGQYIYEVHINQLSINKDIVKQTYIIKPEDVNKYLKYLIGDGELKQEEINKIQGKFIKYIALKMFNFGDILVKNSMKGNIKNIKFADDENDDKQNKVQKIEKNKIKNIGGSNKISSDVISGME